MRAPPKRRARPLFFSRIPPPPTSTLFPYTTLFRSNQDKAQNRKPITENRQRQAVSHPRSEEHTSELQSRLHLVCRLLLEKKKAQKARWLSPRRAATAADIYATPAASRSACAELRPQ